MAVTVTGVSTVAQTPVAAGGSGAKAPARLSAEWQAALLILGFSAVSVVLVVLYPDSYQQDGGTHYLYARWAWVHLTNLLDVWGRPLFTLLYSVPALIGGYPAAKLLTVAIAAATAWQSWRLAIAYGLERPLLVIPFLWVQPSFLLLSSETMTEPLFALLLVIALRLQQAKHRVWAAAVVSATVLARPEGFFLCALWGLWVLFEPRELRSDILVRRLGTAAMLGAGLAAWLIASRLITRDWLYIVHNWPSNWSATVATYGKGERWEYVWFRREVLGPYFEYPLMVGMVAALVLRRLSLALATGTMFFVLHTVLRATGMFGSAGYTRYFVCIAPVIALLVLLGWNVMARGAQLVLRRFATPVIAVATASMLAITFVCAVCYVDDQPWSRDATMVNAAVTWFKAHPRPVVRFAASQSYMCIQFDCDPTLRVVTPGPGPQTMAALRAAPPGTLVVWDAETGPAFYGGVSADSIERVGYSPIYDRADTLAGRLLPHLQNGRRVPRVTPWEWGGKRVQRIWLLYR